MKNIIVDDCHLLGSLFFGEGGWVWQNLWLGSLHVFWLNFPPISTLIFWGIITQFHKKVKDCQTTVCCSFSGVQNTSIFWQKVADLPFFKFIYKLKYRSKPWLAFTPGKVKMPLFAILLWLVGDRFFPRCFARMSFPLFANVDFVVLFTAIYRGMPLVCQWQNATPL